jgi:hypothetical protein
MKKWSGADEGKTEYNQCGQNQLSERHYIEARALLQVADWVRILYYFIRFSPSVLPSLFGEWEQVLVGVYSAEHLLIGCRGLVVVWLSLFPPSPHPYSEVGKGSVAYLLGSAG